MRALRAVLVGALLGGLAAPAMAQETPPLPRPGWSFDGLFGSYDVAAAQRGFWVYFKVCSACHSMKEMHYRDLAAIGLSEGQIKAIAASVQVPQGINDQGEPLTGPALPANEFKAPFPNDAAARAALGGALPPDLSLITNAREGHADYVYGILNGFTNPPKGMDVPAGKVLQRVLPGPPDLHAAAAAR